MGGVGVPADAPVGAEAYVFDVGEASDGGAVDGSVDTDAVSRGLCAVEACVGEEHDGGVGGVDGVEVSYGSCVFEAEAVDAEWRNQRRAVVGVVGAGGHEVEVVDGVGRDDDVNGRATEHDVAQGYFAFADEAVEGHGAGEAVEGQQSVGVCGQGVAAVGGQGVECFGNDAGRVDAEAQCGECGIEVEGHSSEGDVGGEGFVGHSLDDGREAVGREYLYRADERCGYDEHNGHYGPEDDFQGCFHCWFWSDEGLTVMWKQAWRRSCLT